MNQFSVKDASHDKEQPVYKNLNAKINVITGDIEDRNQKNCGYERFTENSQRMKSSNNTVLPADLVVACPITGRPIAKK